MIIQLSWKGDSGLNSRQKKLIYRYTNASSLLEDFWKEVETIMKKEGVKL